MKVVAVVMVLAGCSIFSDSGTERPDFDLDSTTVDDSATSFDFKLTDFGHDVSKDLVVRDASDVSADIPADKREEMVDMDLTPMWIGVGPDGYVTRTFDGVSWTSQQVSTPEGVPHFDEIQYADRTFVATGTISLKGRIFRSDDGEVWSEANYAHGDWIGGVAFGNGRWVSVGGNGTVTFSDDEGFSWVKATPLPFAGRSVHFANGLFVAVGDFGMIATSADGISWTEVVGVDQSTTRNFVYFGHGVWVTYSNDFSQNELRTACLFSTDTLTWMECGFQGSYFRGASVTPTELIVSTSDYFISWSGMDWVSTPVILPARFEALNDVWIGVDGEERFLGNALLTMVATERDGEVDAFSLGWIPK